MRNNSLFYFLFVSTLSACFSASSQVASEKPVKINDVNNWVHEHFAEGKIPPFTFIFGGKSSDSFIREWKFSEEKLQPENDSEKRLYIYSDKQTGLVVKCFLTVYYDFPAVEWFLKFSDVSGKNTPLIENVAVASHTFFSETKGNFILHHLRGSKGAKSDFLPVEDTLSNTKKIILSPRGGRSSDDFAFPFFNIRNPGAGGFVVAIGWSGKWFSEICQSGENRVTLKAGMEKMNLFLYPGEEIRTPAVCLLFWEGKEPMAGHNQFRKFILKHKIRGNPEYPPVAMSLSPNSPCPPCNGFFGCLSDTFALRKIEWMKRMDLVPDVCWMDAGWYEGGTENWQIIGNWKADKEKFPDGLKPVADAAHKIGSKFLLWFEPERVADETKLASEHQDWLLKLPGDITNKYTGKKEFVFNLGLEKARLWMTDYFSGIIKNEGIDYFRQDFNIDPKPYWDANDKPGRTGISEIKYIEGLYAFWDSLLARFPNLKIDNCASGGRRIDLETISRSLPLWRSDYLMDEPEGLQNHTLGLNYYLPAHGTGNLSCLPYVFRSSLGSTMVLFWDINTPADSVFLMKKAMDDFKRLRPYFYDGDYYPLTKPGGLLRDDIWLAYQLNRCENGDGIILAFRRKNCNESSLKIQFKGLVSGGKYLVFDEDRHSSVIKSGRELMDTGYTVYIDGKPGTKLFTYKKIESQ